MSPGVILTFPAALGLMGCAGDFRLGFKERPTIPAGERVTIEPNGQEIIEPPADPDCQVRAKHFRGMVSMPCSQIAREIAP